MTDHDTEHKGIIMTITEDTDMDPKPYTLTAISIGLEGAASTIADHWPLERVELVEAGLDPNDPARMRGLCKRCHDSKTARTKPSGFNGRSLR